MNAVTENTVRPIPEAFDDHRVYLRAMIGFLKATRPAFSYRQFSRRAGFSSPNFLKLVAEGQRNLSESSIAKFGRGLDLDERELAVFEVLVRLGQSNTDAERNRWYAELRRSREALPVGRLEADQYELYSNWVTVVLRELVGLPGFQDDPKWLTRVLRPAVRLPAIKRGLAVLERLRLIERDAQGALQQTQAAVSTGGQVRSLAVRNFHRAMLELATRALDRVPREERNVTGLTVPLSPATYAEICHRVGLFRREIIDIVERDRAPGPKTIHQIQFILFPVTQEVEP